MEKRREFLSSILITATEGGINYWARVVKRDWDLGDTLFMVSLQEAEEGGLHVVDHADIEKGLRLIADPFFEVAADLRKDILYANVMNDAGEIDAEGADVIVQAALFGEIVYG